MSNRESDGAEHTARTGQSDSGIGRPSTCQNPGADCYRDPDLEVRWAEDVSSENEFNRRWLCDPCYAMLDRGTLVSPSEIETRRNGFDHSEDTESEQ